MVETQEKLKVRLIHLHLRELGIEEPTKAQINTVSIYNNATLARPIIIRLINEKKSYRYIAKYLQLSTNSIASIIRGSKFDRTKSVCNLGTE